jgi:hypothetical protein
MKFGHIFFAICKQSAHVWSFRLGLQLNQNAKRLSKLLDLACWFCFDFGFFLLKKQKMQIKFRINIININKKPKRKQPPPKSNQLTLLCIFLWLTTAYIQGLPKTKPGSYTEVNGGGTTGREM